MVIKAREEVALRQIDTRKGVNAQSNAGIRSCLFNVAEHQEVVAGDDQLRSRILWKFSLL